MALRSDKLLGRMAIAARTGPPLLRLTVPPRAARFLVAAGARPVSVDSMSVRFHDRAQDPVGAGEKLARAILRLRESIHDIQYKAQLGSGQAESLRRSVVFLDSAAADAWQAASPGSREPFDLENAAVVAPRGYLEARRVGELFREGRSVILDLTGVPDSDAKRLVDFAAGLIFGLHGTINRVKNRVFLLVPAHEDYWRAPAPEADPGLFVVINQVHEVAGTLTSVLSTSGGEPPERLYSKVHSIADELEAGSLPLDVSGMDLTGLKLDPEDLVGAVWSSETKWPDAGLAEHIRRQSKAIGPGIYLVHDQAAACPPGS